MFFAQAAGAAKSKVSFSECASLLLLVRSVCCFCVIIQHYKMNITTVWKWWNQKFFPWSLSMRLKTRPNYSVPTFLLNLIDFGFWLTGEFRYISSYKIFLQILIIILINKIRSCGIRWIRFSVKSGIYCIIKPTLASLNPPLSGGTCHQEFVNLPVL